MQQSLRLRVHLILFCLLMLLGVSCKQKSNSEESKQSQAVTFPKKNLNPIDRYGDLLVAVQMQRIFPDGKTFVDCTPKFPTDTILKKYGQVKDKTGFDLKSFVLDNFTLPVSPTSDYKTDTTRNATEHIKALWPYLKRDADEEAPGSRIALPNPYIVPGGRFREVYYWDSYFILLGLKDSGEDQLLESIIDNFAHQIDEVGFIPNGNRTYYLGRSQPPFFAEMVNLLATIKDEKSVYLKYRDAMQKEYDFWMKGASTLGDEAQKGRVVKMADGSTLNRYYSDRSTPRAESYYEDVKTAKEATGREAKDVYLNINAACESGWDFSSRWFAEPDALATIRTTRIIPVDLNALLYNLEKALAKASAFAKDNDAANTLNQAAENRRKAVDKYLWDYKNGIYQDYDLDKSDFTGVPSLAMAYPLYFGLASQKQADDVAKQLRTKFLKPGGLATTLNDNRQQWDYPNGWPPLQWLAIRGLQKYGQRDLAEQVKTNWLALNNQVYKRTGKMLEKYNVVDTTLVAGGGEYANQDGFGWTNGVYLDLKGD